MITPTIGRIVLIFDRPGSADPQQPEPAIVCYVHTRRMINVAGFNAEGHVFRERNVRLIQDGDAVPKGEVRAEWMPYQKAVANGETAPVRHAAPRTHIEKIQADAKDAQADTPPSTAKKAVESFEGPQAPTMALGPAGTSSDDSPHPSAAVAPSSPPSGAHLVDELPHVPV